MKNFYKIFSFLILILCIGQPIKAKPLPPGSGEGDVKANILILLDSSNSMDNKIGDGLPNITSITVNPTTGDRYLTAANKRDGGLFLINSNGVRTNITGTRDNGTTYEARTWWANGNTDRSCDWGINQRGNISQNSNISTNRMLHGAFYLSNVTIDGTNINNETLLFVGQYQPNNNNTAVFALDSNFQCRLAIKPGGGRRGTQIRGFDMSVDANNNNVIAIYGRDGRNAYIMTCNLDEGDCVRSAGRRSRNNVWSRVFDASRLRLNNNSSMIYFADDGNVYGYPTRDQGTVKVMRGASTRFCRGRANATGNQVTFTTMFDISPNDNDVMYVGGNRQRKIQNVSWTSDTTCTATVEAGTDSSSANVDAAGDAIDAGTLAAGSIRITNGLGAMNISNNRLIFSHAGYVDELTLADFADGTEDTAWQIQYGGTLFSRLEGAKKAIISIFSDSTLNTGAQFGFGHWNAGERNLGRTVRPPRGRGGGHCHNDNNPCNYYGGWVGNHPNGRSRICTSNSCLNVGIGPEGSTRAIPIVRNIRTSFGTDSEAFSQIAHDYFTGDVSPLDEDSDCQLNYVIVIGDGMQKKTGLPSSNNRGRTATRLEALRGKGVKTLFVAYGNGIRAEGMTSFDELAVAGSCAQAGDADCEPTIVAATPEELQTVLQQKIRQIVAERLSFTAPSITATIEQGGSLYQAQFEYEQYGEWKGTILRKRLFADGRVAHDPNFPGNWNAAEQVRLQSSGSADYSGDDSRNLWTVIPDADGGYIGNWDNLNDDNAELLIPEMEMLGFRLSNYHTTSSTCGGLDTTIDEARGLFRFLAGQDFFDYDGDCTTNPQGTVELRDHVLGDIYHSQLIEIGAPNASVEFDAQNEEAYFRTINNYQGFINSHQNRRSVVYAGSNSGLLHAFNAETGQEEWAFLPPVLIGKLPTLINSALDGRVGGDKGGSNAIFGVDGSPVVHDVFIKGLEPDGTISTTEDWHTILFVPFGRGGSGFTVLDVTNPIVENGLGPLHMFTVYNDYINNVVYRVDSDGLITSYEYSSGSASLGQSEEGVTALNNYNTAAAADGGTDSATTTNRDNIQACQTQTELAALGQNFKTNGTNSCFEGTTFTFKDIQLNTPNNVAIDKALLNVTELKNGAFEPLDFSEARMVNGEFVITFNEDKVINRGDQEITDAQGNVTQVEGDNIFIQTSCQATSIDDTQYDYSKLGETWSTPRIVRLPSDTLGLTSDAGGTSTDKYVAIMGAGMSSSNSCTGSAVYLVDLSDMANPGRIYGHEYNNGPITIVDTHPSGVSFGNSGITTDNGSDINNAVPTTPVVITPDTAFGIPWKGAMVYINDREGKITKINLTDCCTDSANFFDQTTLFRLNASSVNRRYSFFSMDAGIGLETKDFWLFGGTGDFNALGDKTRGMDNILYGIRDRDYPLFRHLNTVTVPEPSSDTFSEIAHNGANLAMSIDDLAVCSDVTEDETGDLCPSTESGWVYHLDRPDEFYSESEIAEAVAAGEFTEVNKPAVGDLRTDNDNNFRKASAPPTLFKGQVYYPVYEPPSGSNKCAIGKAFICVHDDECGTDNSHKLVKGKEAQVQTCTFVRDGVLSELVIFGDQLFANVAGPSENEDTLYSILSIPGEVLTNQGGWRDTGF